MFKGNVSLSTDRVPFLASALDTMLSKSYWKFRLTFLHTESTWHAKLCHALRLVWLESLLVHTAARLKALTLSLAPYSRHTVLVHQIPVVSIGHLYGDRGTRLSYEKSPLSSGNHRKPSCATARWLCSRAPPLRIIVPMDGDSAHQIFRSVQHFVSIANHNHEEIMLRPNGDIDAYRSCHCLSLCATTPTKMALLICQPDRTASHPTTVPFHTSVPVSQ